MKSKCINYLLLSVVLVNLIKISIGSNFESSPVTKSEYIKNLIVLKQKHKKNDSDENFFKAKNIKPTFSFVHAFFASFSVILVSEIGDKTFFIAAIMAMKHSRMTVYLGAMLALGLMTLLSALLGNILTKVIPHVYTYYASSILFGLFGFKMLREGWQMNDSDVNDEYEEANEELKESEEKNKNLETGRVDENSSTRKFINIFRKYMSPIFLQAFVLTFLAEWGDRSQISIVIFSAGENVFGTIFGGILGDIFCTALAVIGGRMISQRISIRTVTLIGAFIFLSFAFSAIFVSPNY